MYIEVAAHRGNVAEYPENTILAYRSAYEIGADMIELDLYMTKDGEIVLIHDGDLARTADVSGKISELTLDEVLRADVGIKNGERFRGTRVPTLRQFCEFVANEDPAMQFNFEFKDYLSDGKSWSKADNLQRACVYDSRAGKSRSSSKGVIYDKSICF